MLFVIVFDIIVQSLVKIVNKWTAYVRIDTI
jgi:hypothetical protein